LDEDVANVPGRKEGGSSLGEDAQQHRADNDDADALRQLTRLAAADTHARLGEDRGCK
jgi:hypothetical protein